MATNGNSSDDRLALLIAAGKRVVDAAEEVGVSRRTAYRRHAHPEFRKKIRELRREMFDQALGTLAEAGVQAVGALKFLLGSADERVRLNAAKATLQLGVQLREQLELDQRLAALEDLGNGNQQISSIAAGETAETQTVND